MFCLADQVGNFSIRTLSNLRNLSLTRYFFSGFACKMKKGPTVACTSPYTDWDDLISRSS